MRIATMRLTSFTDFGLRALMQLAGEPQRTFTTDEIARTFAISRNHLAKIIRELATPGIVATQRGAGGGELFVDCAGAGNVTNSAATSNAVQCFGTMTVMLMGNLGRLVPARPPNL